MYSSTKPEETRWATLQKECQSNCIDLMVLLKQIWSEQRQLEKELFHDDGEMDHPKI
jgi:hypothetical protein